MRWLRQRGSPYADCVPIAICNCLRWFGLTTPRPRTKRWEQVVDAAGCRYGTTTNVRRVARFLGAEIRPIKRIELHLPAIITVWNPEMGHSLHSVAALEARDGRLKVIDYRVEDGPLTQWLVPKTHDELPRRNGGAVDREAFGDALFFYGTRPRGCYKVLPLGGNP